MENHNLDYEIESGILIHQLPNELIGKAMKVLPNKVKHTFIDGSGMRVYFASASNCNKFIRKKFIELDGVMFNIYCTATYLTVFSISSYPYAEETIKTHMEAKRLHVSNLYQISNTNNYRIILDVPEVLANFELSPISVDSDPFSAYIPSGTLFPVAFYCRVCDREGHRQYQCLSLKKRCEANDTGYRTGGNSSNNSRTSRQENDVMPSVSGVRNTGGGTTGTQSFGNLSARVNVTAAYPRTSITGTDAEIYMLARQNLKTGSNNGVHKTTGGAATGNQSFGNLARQNVPAVCPSTSRKSTATGSNSAVPGTPTRSTMTSQSSSKQKYPCKEIVKIINKVRGCLSPKKLRKFLEVVYHKQMVMKYALEFTNDIPGLIQQIRRIIINFYQQSSGSDIAKKQIRLLEDLCERLHE